MGTYADLRVSCNGRCSDSKISNDSDLSLNQFLKDLRTKGWIFSDDGKLAFCPECAKRYRGMK